MLIYCRHVLSIRFGHGMLWQGMLLLWSTSHIRYDNNCWPTEVSGASNHTKAHGMLDYKWNLSSDDSLSLLSSALDAASILILDPALPCAAKQI